MNVERRETYRFNSLVEAQNIFGRAMKFFCIFSRYDDDPAIKRWDLKNRVLQQTSEMKICLDPHLFVTVGENVIRALHEAKCADEAQNRDFRSICRDLDLGMTLSTGGGVMAQIIEPTRLAFQRWTENTSNREMTV